MISKRQYKKYLLSHIQRRLLKESLGLISYDVQKGHNLSLLIGPNLHIGSQKVNLTEFYQK